MVGIGETVRVQSLKVGCQVVYPLSIEELVMSSIRMTDMKGTHLTDDIRGLEVPQCLRELSHGAVKVSLIV